MRRPRQVWYGTVVLRPTRAGNTDPSAYPVARTKGSIVLQLIDLLTSFSLVEVFGAAADRILHWEN